MKKKLWLADPAHSEVYFRVRHLMITTVTGHFRKFRVEVTTEDDDFTKATNIEFVAEVHSIDTKNQDRDNHLRSPDFFNASESGEIVFFGDHFEGTKESGKLTGQLTIKGVTKTIVLNVEFGGIVVDTYGQTKAGFTVEGKISRKEFGILWDAVTEAGNVVVSDEVKVFAEIQLIKQV